MRRMLSMPPVATLSEPNDSDEGDEEEPPDDHSQTNSQVMRPPVASASSSERNAMSSPSASRPRTLSSTQLSPTRVPYNPFEKGEEMLEKLNTPGKGQTQLNSNTSRAMPPPSQNASQIRAMNDHASVSSSTQPSTSRPGPSTHHRNSTSGTAPSTSSRAFPLTISASVMPTQDRNGREAGHKSITGAAVSPIRGSVGSSRQSQVSPSRLPPVSQPVSRPGITSSVSTLALTQPSKPSSAFGSNKGKEKEQIIILSDDDTVDTIGISQPQTPARAKTPMPAKKPNSVNTSKKSPTQVPSSQVKRPPFTRATSTSSEDEEFPTLQALSQPYRRSDSTSSPGRPPASSSSIDNRLRREEGEDSDVGPTSSISQAPRRLARTDDRRKTLPSLDGRERADRTKALSKRLSKPSSSRVLSSSQDPKQKPHHNGSLPKSTTQAKRKGTNGLFPSTQPSNGSSMPGPGRPPLSTQPASLTSGTRSKPTSTASRATTKESPSEPEKPSGYLGFIDLSSGDEKEKKQSSVNGGAKGLATGTVIDLTLDDDGDDAVSSSSMLKSQPTTSSARELTSQSTQDVLSTEPVGLASGAAQPSSPPTVRPRPRVSVLPKEKMADARPQPTDSRPLDVSRRRSNVTNDERPDKNDTTPERMLVEKDIDEAHSPEAGATTEMVVPIGSTAAEPASAEPNFGFVADDDMGVVHMDDSDGPAGKAPDNSSPPMDLDMQPADIEAASEQPTSMDEEKNKFEETSAPIERAREIRSPSASAQMEENQSQSKDGNETDLILGPSNSSRTSESDVRGHDIPSQEPAAESPEGVQQMSASQSETTQKPETLTDKLGLLALSRPSAAAGYKDRQNESDISMEGQPGDRTSEGAVAQDAPRCEGGNNPIVQAEPSEPQTTLINNAAAPFTTVVSPSALVPASGSTSPAPSPTMSNEKATFNRANSPGAACAPAPRGNFMGLYSSKKGSLATSSRSGKDKQVEIRVSPNAIQPDQSKLPESVIEKTKASDGRSIAMKPAESIGQSSQPVTSNLLRSSELPGTPESPIIDTANQQASMTGTGTAARSASSLSPRSRAKQRIPDPQPPRKLNLPQPTPLSALGVTPSGEANKGAGYQSSAPTRAPLSEGREQDSGLPSAKPDSAAMATARALNSILTNLKGSHKGSAASDIPSPVGNGPKEGNYSGSELKPDSMPYVKKRILEHTMQSPDSSASGSPMDESSVLPGQSEAMNASQPASATKLKEVQQAGKSTSNGPELRSSASSEETDADLEIKDSSDQSDSEEEAPVESSAVGASIPVALHRRYFFARKSTSKLRPRTTAWRIGRSNRSPDSSSRGRKAPINESQRPFRKRAISNSSHTSDAGEDGNRLVRRNRIAAKRARVQDSTDEEVLSRKDVNGLRRSSRQTSSSSAASTLRSRSTRSQSASSADPMDVMGEALGDDSESSAGQPSTPVSDLASRVSEITFTPHPGSKYPIEAPRCFIREPVWYRVDDIPTELVNEVNDTPEWCKNPVLLRQIFESAILANTDDEPEAPPVRVINDIDDEPTPPFEFYYTNRMYHGHGVPPPQYETLQGCTCIGKCDPLSKTCYCAIRQRKIFKEQGIDHHGFVYDEKGRVQIHEFPIFECNDACGCVEECTNRVVQNGRRCHVNIVKTRNKGWGIFAGKKIQKGTFIGIYSGEILTQEESIKRGRWYNKIGKTYLFDIDFWHIKGEDEDAKYCIDAYHVGNFTRFLNHSCDPNCRINAVHINDANIEKALLAIFAIKDVNPGEELTFNYFGEIDEQEIKEKREDQAYQRCLCGSQKCYGKLFTYSSAE